LGQRNESVDEESAMSPKDRENRNVRGLATARKIEREAVRLATIQGLEHTTVDQICEAVGVTQRTFFNHFATKEDALLGIDLPHVDEERARAYLSSTSVGILSGALELVELPASQLADPEFLSAQFRLIGTSSALRARQSERLNALSVEIQHLIYLKLKSQLGDTTPVERLQAHAATIMALGAGLMNSRALGIALDPSTANNPAPWGVLESLKEIWPRLL
jgi:AcrR family transcriptional regulator